MTHKQSRQAWINLRDEKSIFYPRKSTFLENENEESYFESYSTPLNSRSAFYIRQKPLVHNAILIKFPPSEQISPFLLKHHRLFEHLALAENKPQPSPPHHPKGPIFRPPLSIINP